MFVRVVRFTDVTPERMESVRTRIAEAGGPPPGVAATEIQVLADPSQGTVVVLQRYASAADMEAAARVFEAMEPGETPGTRASVDACEVLLEVRP